MVSNRSSDAERRVLEPPECKEENRRENSEDDGFCFCCVPLWGEDKVVENVWQHKDGEVESWQLEGPKIKQVRIHFDNYDDKMNVRSGADMLHDP